VVSQGIQVHVILHFESGPEAGKKVTVKPGERRTFGRGEKAEVPMPYDSLLSGLHFAVECSESGAKLRDLGSRNGTKLNGAAVKEAALRNQDYVIAGNTGFIVELVTAASVADAPVERPQTAPAAPPRAIEPPADSHLAANWNAKPAVAIAPKPPQPKPPAAAPREPAALLDFLRSQKSPLFAVLDAARDIRISEALRQFRPALGVPEDFMPPEQKEAATAAEAPQIQSLFEKDQAAELEIFAPYLVRLPPASPLLETLAGEGWGRSWGIYLTSDQPFAAVRSHLRSFLNVEMPDGRQVHFRFYDPRVLRVFLSKCNAAEAKEFFGQTASFIVESAAGESALQFEPEGSGAASVTQPLLDAAPALAAGSGQH